MGCCCIAVNQRKENNDMQWYEQGYKSFKWWYGDRWRRHVESIRSKGLEENERKM